VGAGTGGTSATIGRYVRYLCHRTKICVVDPENSAFYPAYQSGDWSVETGAGSRIEGIGRPKVEASFLPSIVDKMIQVPDAASLATMRIASGVLGRRVGGSTGTNLWGAFALIARMLERGETGSVVTLLCDGGERYANTYYNDTWIENQALDLHPPYATVQRFLSSGQWR
jgi:cysteine synthase A